MMNISDQQQFSLRRDACGGANTGSGRCERGQILVMQSDQQRLAFSASKNAPLISAHAGRVKIWGIRTDEELMIASPSPASTSSAQFGKLKP
jgi:hypothetical protein